MQYAFPQKVLFRHCDPAGIVFYPRYFEMLNDCVEAFFDTLGYPFANMHPIAGVPTAQINMQFTAPSKLGDHLTLKLEGTRLGNSALDLRFSASCEDTLRFHGKSTLVHVNADGRPHPWPDDTRVALTPYIRSIE